MPDKRLILLAIGMILAGLLVVLGAGFNAFAWSTPSPMEPTTKPPLNTRIIPSPTQDGSISVSPLD